MDKIEEINRNICGKYYQIYFEEPRREICMFIYGEMLNFNPSGKVSIFTNKGSYIFEHNSIISMIPMPNPDKLSEREKDIFEINYK
jgi:hypothetical protein